MTPNGSQTEPRNGGPVQNRPDTYELHVRDLGPVDFSESKFAARARFHQAWYRLEVLRVATHGASTHQGRSIPRGSILPEWAAALGMNFLSDEARSLYGRRRAEGWGLDPVRCQAHMTSSQALTLNVFGPLIADPMWFARVLSVILAEPVGEVLEVHLEHAPTRPSCALGDRTIVDLWLLLALPDGRALSVVVEVKYCDRFNSRYLPVWDNDRYRRLTADQQQPSWDWDNPALRSRTVNQLLRCHAMGEYLGRRSGSSSARLVVLHHQSDQSAIRAVSEYSLVAPRGTVVPRDLGAFVEAMRLGAADRGQVDVVDTLKQRYVDEERSDAWWDARDCASRR